MLFCWFGSSAQLAITVSPPKIVGQKAVITLAMTNNLAETIESARAICFLLDEQGKMVGQSAKWVIGGEKGRPVLPSKTGGIYNFVIVVPESTASTNWLAKVSFTRLILEKGKQANPAKDITITTAKSHE